MLSNLLKRKPIPLYNEIEHKQSMLNYPNFEAFSKLFKEVVLLTKSSFTANVTQDATRIVYTHMVQKPMVFSLRPDALASFAKDIANNPQAFDYICTLAQMFYVRLTEVDQARFHSYLAHVHAVAYTLEDNKVAVAFFGENVDSLGDKMLRVINERKKAKANRLEFLMDMAQYYNNNHYYAIATMIALSHYKE